MDSNKNEEHQTDVPDNRNKVPVKVAGKRANAGKLNLHLVSSTPMNPLKNANFFDESYQFGSPIRSGSSTTTGVNSNKNNSPDNKKNKQPITTMLNNEEENAGASPFPFLTKLAVKKMTICTSDEDTDDNIFVKPSEKVAKLKKQLDDIPDESNTDSEDYNTLVISRSTTKAIVEPIKEPSENNKNDKTITKTKPSKSNDENKENINIATNEIKSKSKRQATEKNTTKTKPAASSSAKQKKSDENTNEKKNITKTKETKDDGNNEETPSAIINNTTKRKVPESGVRKSSRAAQTFQTSVPYWIFPGNKSYITQNNTHVLTRTQSADLNNSTVSIKDNKKRPKTAPEPIQSPKKASPAKAQRASPTKAQRASPTKAQKKSENTTITKVVEKKTNKKEVEKKAAKKKSENTVTEVVEKKNNKIESVIEKTKPKTQSKEKVNLKNTFLIDEVPEKNISRILINDFDKIEVVSEKNNRKSNEQDNTLGQFSKEIHDKQNNERKNKFENITRKLRLSQSNLDEDTLQQSVLENEVFEPENIQQEDEIDISRTLVNEESIKSRKPRSTEIDKLFSQTFDKIIPPRSTRKRQKTNPVPYTPGNTLKKQNETDEKSTVIKTATNTNTKKPIINETKSKALPSKRSTPYPNDIIPKFDNSNSESSIDISPVSNRKSRSKKQMVIKNKPIKTKSKVSVNTRFATERQHNKSKSKQVNFNLNDTEMENAYESDSLSSVENAAKIYRNVIQKHYTRSKKYPRKKLFYDADDSTAGVYGNSRKMKYNDTLDDDALMSAEDSYCPQNKRRKYPNDRRRGKVDHSCSLNFKERALAVQVPAVTRSLTEIQHRGEIIKMECFGNFPREMTQLNENSSLRGTSFINNFFAGGVMELTLGTIKKCNASKNHTYFVVLDGIAEICIANSTKIMRIGDCCIIPKSRYILLHIECKQRNKSPTQFS